METNNKLRNALSDVTWLLESILEAFSKGTGGVYKSDVAEAIDNARAALSEPVRNCEVGTAEEQSARFDQFCHVHINAQRCCGDCPAFHTTRDDCELVWAQLPYEEGGDNADKQQTAR